MNRQEATALHPPGSAPAGKKPDWGLVALAAAVIPLVWWFKAWLTDRSIASVDLPGHIAIIRRMILQLSSFRLDFYDPVWLTGWPAFRFYPFLPHLVAALASQICRPWWQDPVAFAVHAILVAGCATLPLSIWYFLLPMARQIRGVRAGDTGTVPGLLLAASVAFVSFWFLNQDTGYYGIGASGPMFIGLFGQVFGWHLLLLQFGSMARFLIDGERKHLRAVSIYFALLVVSHPLTAMFALGMVVLLGIWFAGSRLCLIKAHLLGLGLAGFWLVPALALASTYSVTDITAPEGDFLRLLFRYPACELLQHLQACAARGFQPIDLATLLVGAFMLVFCALATARRSNIAVAFYLSTLIIALIASSGFTAASVPFTVHLYRMLGYSILILAALLALVPLSIHQLVAEKAGRRLAAATASAIIIILSAGVYSAGCFPDPARNMLPTLTGPKYVRHEAEVLDYFKRQPQKGRVLFESTKEYSKFPWLSQHYLESQLWDESGFDTVNGLFIQSSLAYFFPVGTAWLLGANTYTAPVPFTGTAQRDTAEEVRQLREEGISHVVCAAEGKLYHNLLPYLSGKIERFDPYAIMPIGTGSATMVSPVTKQIIGYIDQRHSLPFRFLEYYFYSHPRLARPYDLIDLTGSRKPLPLSALIVNCHGAYPPPAAPPPVPAPYVVYLEFSPEAYLDHYFVRYDRGTEISRYEQTARYLDQQSLPSTLGEHAAPVPQAGSESTSAPTLRFSPDFQTIYLEHLQPGRPVRINYAYFPYWRSGDGVIYRGSAERIFFLPSTDHAVLRYDSRADAASWIGVAVSLASLLLTLGVWPAARITRGRRPLTEPCESGEASA